MAVGTKAGAFAALTLLFLVYLPHLDPQFKQAISLLAIFSLIYANLVAMRQQQLRRFFAYSGISHAAFLLIPIVSGTPHAFQAIAFYLVVYALATLGAFAVLVFLERDVLEEKGMRIPDLQGLYTRHRGLALILALSLLTLAGIPPTAGFFAKFYVFELAYQSGNYLLLVIGLLTTVLSAYYYLRIVLQLFLESPNSAEQKPALPLAATVVALFSFLGLLFLSFYPAPLFNFLFP
jgi:NADH-quinone oxidoreductase subunit N